jgi:thiol reductant ABC exporter CydC subunit
MRALLGVARLASAGRGSLLLAGFLGVLAAGSAVALMATSAWLISRAAERPPVLYLMVAIVAVRAFAITRGFARYAERLVAHDAAFRVLADLRVRVYEHLERLAPASLSAFRSGDLLSRLVADVDTLQDLWLRLLLPYGVAILVGGASVVLIGWLLPAAGAVLAVSLLVVAWLSPLVASGIARRAQRRVAPLQGELSAATLDLLRAAPELVAYGAADRQLLEIRRVDRELVRAHARSASGVGVGGFVATFAAGAAVWAGLALGVPAVGSGRLSGVLLGVVVLTPLAVHEVVSGLAAAAQQIPRIRGAAERLMVILQTPPPVGEPLAPAPMPTGPYGMQLAGVAAGWPDGPNVLESVSLDLAPGQRIALIGSSGSGKSTLTFLLVKFLTPREGSVDLVGVDGTRSLLTCDGDEVRRVVGLFAQDTYVFDTTIAENVRLARPQASDEEVRDSLRRARVLDWIDELPAGMDTHMGERGALVSGGQRQRIALARILLADFPVLVLDEPTEHLDEPTAAALMTDLLTQTGDRTVLLVTHRWSDLSRFNRVLRLSAGRMSLLV